MTRLVPIGRGTVSVILKGQGTHMGYPPGARQRLDLGELRTGALSGFDVDGFLARARDGGFFALDEVSEGTFPIDAMDFKASVSDGVATIEKAEARSAAHRIVLSGTSLTTAAGSRSPARSSPPQQAAGQAGRQPERRSSSADRGARRLFRRRQAARPPE